MTWPTTAVATGDLVTAAQLNRLPIALAEASGAAASYTFSSIPQAWTHLMLVCSLQTAAGASVDDLWVQFNGDTGANYINQYLRAVDTTVSGDGTNSATKILAAGVPGQSAGAFSTNILFVANYSAETNHSLVATGVGAYGNAAGTNVRIGLAGGSWIPVAAVAITSITLSPSTNSFVDGSIVTLYGMGQV